MASYRYLLEGLLFHCWYGQLESRVCTHYGALLKGVVDLREVYRVLGKQPFTSNSLCGLYAAEMSFRVRYAGTTSFWGVVLIRGCALSCWGPQIDLTPFLEDFNAWEKYAEQLPLG